MLGHYLCQLADAVVKPRLNQSQGNRKLAFQSAKDIAVKLDSSGRKSRFPRAALLYEHQQFVVPDITPDFSSRVDVSQ